MTDYTQAWQQYWRAGHRDSCFVDQQGLNVAALFAPAFNPASEPSKVLDAACGAGALMTVLAEHYPQAHFTGVDAAAQATEDGAIVTAPLEQLPFADQEFDAVVSQFGVEYSNLEQSLIELNRVVKPEGKLVFLMHHVNSAIWAHAKAELERTEDLAAGDGVVAAMELMVVAVASREPLQTAVSRVADAFERASKQPMTETRQWLLDFVAEVMETFAKQPAEYLVSNVQRLQQEFGGFRSRMQAMVNAAKGRDDIDDVGGALSCLRDRNIEIDVVNTAEGQPFAWRLMC